MDIILEIINASIRAGAEIDACDWSKSVTLAGLYAQQICQVYKPLFIKDYDTHIMSSLYINGWSGTLEKTNYDYFIVKLEKKSVLFVLAFYKASIAYRLFSKLFSDK